MSSTRPFAELTTKKPKATELQTLIHVITLGVHDLAKSRNFYEAMGFRPTASSDNSLVFFKCGGIVLALYSHDGLAEDITIPATSSGFRGVALARNVATTAEVRRILTQAEKNGGKIVKPAQDTPWGGYAGYFSDPDKHYWEVAWNPKWLDEHGKVFVPD